MQACRRNWAALSAAVLWDTAILYLSRQKRMPPVLRCINLSGVILLVLSEFRKQIPGRHEVSGWQAASPESAVCLQNRFFCRQNCIDQAGLLCLLSEHLFDPYGLCFGLAAFAFDLDGRIFDLVRPAIDRLGL